MLAEKVNHPDHYHGQKYECIEVMRDVFGEEAVKNFCQLNAFKYLWRSDKKNGKEDIQKAIWYLNELIKENNMKPNGEEKDVIMGYIDHDGKIQQVKFVGSFEVVEDDEYGYEPEEDDEFAKIHYANVTLARTAYDLYKSFIDEGFEKNHAYGLTRDYFRNIILGVKHDHVEED